MPETRVAIRAEQTPECAGAVAVVNAKASVPSRWRPAANSAYTSLLLVDPTELCSSYMGSANSLRNCPFMMLPALSCDPAAPPAFAVALDANRATAGACGCARCDIDVRQAVSHRCF